MVPSPCQYSSVSGKVCNRFLPARDNDQHRLCTSCRGKSCSISDHCKDCCDWLDEKWFRVGEYLARLSVQREKKERNAKASFSFFFFFFFPPSVNALLCQFPFPVGTSVVTTTLSSAASAVTFLAASPVVSAAPFVPPHDVTPSEPSFNHRREDSTSAAEQLQMSEFEKVAFIRAITVGVSRSFVCCFCSCFGCCSWLLQAPVQAVSWCWSVDFIWGPTTVPISIVFLVPDSS